MGGGGGRGMTRRKVKNGKKSTWGQCFTRPVPNFRLVTENFCFSLPNQRAANSGVVSRVLTRTVHEL